MAPIAVTPPAGPSHPVRKQPKTLFEASDIEDSVEAICYGPFKLSTRFFCFPAPLGSKPYSSSIQILCSTWVQRRTLRPYLCMCSTRFFPHATDSTPFRDPEYHGCFWMNPLAIHFAMINASDMLLLSDDPHSPERILAGNRRQRPANKAGWAIHSAIHRHHPHINAACHAHTLAGKTWSATHTRLKMLDQDVCKFHGNALTLYNTYGGVVLGSALGEGEAIASAMTRETKGCILANHGLLTVGHTVDEAGYLFGLLEKSCRIQLDLAKSGMEVHEIEEREAEFNFRVESRSDSLYWEFQPEYDYEVMMANGSFEDLMEQELELDLHL